MATRTIKEIVVACDYVPARVEAALAKEYDVRLLLKDKGKGMTLKAYSYSVCYSWSKKLRGTMELFLKPKTSFSPMNGYMVVEVARGCRYHSSKEVESMYAGMAYWVEYYPTVNGAWAINDHGPGKFPGFPKGFDDGTDE